MTQEAQIGQGVDLPPHTALIAQATFAGVMKHLRARHGEMLQEKRSARVDLGVKHP
jgi:hypothetical protein